MGKKTFILYAFAMLAMASCTKGIVTKKDFWWSGDGDVTKVCKTFKVGGFEKIVLTGSVDVKYVQGDTVSVTAKGARKMVERLDVTSDGMSLYVKCKPEKGVNINIGSGSAVVYVTSPDIIAVSITGSGDFRSKGHVDTDNMKIKVKGSGDVSFAGIICDTLDVSVFGSGDVELKKVKAAVTMLDVKGSGDIRARFAGSGSVESRVFGSGDISLKGTVRSEKHVVKGSGDVDTGKLTVR